MLKYSGDTFKSVGLTNIRDRPKVQWWGSCIPVSLRGSLGVDMITVESIRQALQCEHPSCVCHRPNGLVHCPAHADSTPSLSVTEKDGKILVYCHGGCPQDRVLSALKEEGLWPSGNGSGHTPPRKRELVATYGYKDATGTLLFEVCRFRNPDGSKTFSQRRPIPGGGFIWGLRAGEYQCFGNSANWYPVGRKGPPTLATILEEVRQLREDLNSRNRALLSVPEAAAFLGIPEKSVRNRLGPKATDPFPVTPVRLGRRVLFRRYDLEQFVETSSQK